MPDKHGKTSMSIEAMPAKPKTFSDDNLEQGYGVGGANNVSTGGAKPGGSIKPESNATPKMNLVDPNRLVKMHKGGMVPKTGPYQLKKGEKVIPANKVKTMASKMDAATKGLGAPDKPARVKKTTHMHIEPTDNKGFIVKHVEHENGMPNGKTKHHVFTKAKDMHAHVAKTYPMPAAEAAPEAPAPDAARCTTRCSTSRRTSRSTCYASSERLKD